MRIFSLLISDPGSPLDEYPELVDNKHVSLLKFVIWVLLGGATILMAILLTGSREYQWRIFACSGLLILGASAFAVLRFRGAIPTVRLLVFGCWMVVTVTGFFGEGLRAPILLAYPGILIFGGWMLGAHSCLRLFLASIVAVTAMAVSQMTGFIDSAKPAPPLLVAFVHMITLAISTACTLYLLRLFRERYSEERRLNGEIKLNLLAVEKRESNLRRLAEHIPGLVFEGDRSGRCSFANHGFVKFFGIPIHQLEGTEIRGMLGPDASKAFISSHERVLQGDIVEFGARMQSAQGEWHSFDVTLVPKHGAEGTEVTGLYGLLYDVTKREESAAELLARASHDPLTGLANRLLLHDRLAHAMEHAARFQAELGVMVIDLDRFKFVNDTLGHAAGDQLLCEIARRLKSLVRASDTIARVGGDEFVLLMAGDASADAVQAVAVKILSELSFPVVLGTQTTQVGASIGIAIYPNSGQTAEQLVRAADGAMYEAKAAGRNCYRISRDMAAT